MKFFAIILLVQVFAAINVLSAPQLNPQLARRGNDDREHCKLKFIVKL